MKCDNLKFKSSICLVFLTVVFFSMINNVEASINYISSYDADELAESNPQEGQPVASYILDGDQIFVAAVAIQTGGITEGSEAELTLWNSTDTFIYKREVDEYGCVGFTLKD